MNKRLITTTGFLLALLLVGSRVALADDDRISITSQGLASEQGTILPGPEDKYTALSTGGDRKQSPRSAEQQKAGAFAVPNAAPNTDFWFYDAWVDLYADCLLYTSDAADE